MQGKDLINETLTVEEQRHKSEILRYQNAVDKENKIISRAAENVKIFEAALNELLELSTDEFSKKHPNERKPKEKEEE